MRTLSLLLVGLLCLTTHAEDLVPVTQQDLQILRGTEPQTPTALWQWTQPAAHHASVVRVTAGSSGGSGVYVRWGEMRCVLTAAHVLSGPIATVHWSDGTQSTGPVFTDADGHDVGWIGVSHDGLVPVEVAEQDASDSIEVAGFGGPRDQMRHFACRVLRLESHEIQANGPVTHGDSGGPWFAAGQVVGIQSTGGEPIARFRDEHGHSWPIYGTCRSARVGPIRRFLGRVHQRIMHAQPGGT